MNHAKKLLSKIFKALLILILLFFCFYKFLLSDFNPIFDDDVFKSVKKELVKSRKEKLNNLINLYAKTHDINSIKSNPFRNNIRFGLCPSLDIVRYFGYNFKANIKLPFVKLIYALKIEKEFNNEECLKTLFLNCDYLNNTIGIKNASKYYFKKSYDNLSEKEILTLIVMFENPSFYNPIRRPEKVKTKVDLFEKMIKNKTN